MEPEDPKGGGGGSVDFTFSGQGSVSRESDRGRNGGAEGAKPHRELTQSRRIPLRAVCACQVVGTASVADVE